MWAQEPWFDRSHNIVLIGLSAPGLWVFSLRWLVYFRAFDDLERYWKNRFSLFEAAGISSLFAAYSFHNLFVFDNLTSYFVFFSIWVLCTLNGWRKTE